MMEFVRTDELLLKRLTLVAALSVLAVSLSCSKHTSPTAPTTGAAGALPSSPANAGPVGILVGAGDVGFCGSPGMEATASLMDMIGGTVFTAGDNAYMGATADAFRTCYEPTWGRHKSRTRPVPGNHEYENGSAAYYSYFGAAAGPAGAGYYSYTVGSWRVFALNSEIPSTPGSPQLEWLRGELSGNRTDCAAVYWHRPLFSSGRNGDNADMRSVWRTLYEFNVDLVINGHDHTYERFAPQDPDGRPDTARGIRQFVVGTGGAPLYEFQTVHANSEVRGAAWGVAVFTLASHGYQWEFVPVAGQSFRDAGTATCH